MVAVGCQEWIRWANGFKDKRTSISKWKEFPSSGEMWKNTSLMQSTRKENAGTTITDETAEETKSDLSTRYGTDETAEETKSTDETAEDSKLNSKKLKELRPEIWKQRQKINQLKVTLHEAEKNEGMAKTKKEKQKEEAHKQELIAQIAEEQKTLKKISGPLHRTSVVRAYFIR